MISVRMKIEWYPGYAFLIVACLAAAPHTSLAQETKKLGLEQQIAVRQIAITARCEQEDENPEKPSFGSLQKSLLFPGWGQIAEKRYIEGAIFLGTTIFCLAEIFSCNHKGNVNYDLYKAADNTEDAVKYRDLTEKYDVSRNRYILAAFGVWAVNLADIYVIVKGKKNSPKSLRFRLEYGTEPKAVLVLSYRF
jgi:hypothetical protein